MIVIGIDEAGRGSLIGPMIVAGVAIDDKYLEVLKRYGVKDSKKLTRKKREELFNLITFYSKAVMSVKVFPEEIDKENLNKLTYVSIIKILSALSVLKPSIVTIDKVGNMREVEEFVKGLNVKANIVHNADVYFTECSSASIIAKVIRDRYIESLKTFYGDFGSGYPGDERTIEWVKKVYSSSPSPPPIIRRTWKILQDIAPNYYIEKW
ncbi:MAG: ribonuclease HII [Sulfolobaceae archaeon]|jgi:ribonuclease HII